jgi:hypothetical protein
MGEQAEQDTTDRLALALEDVGFDVGRAFPMLGGKLDRDGNRVVELGRVTEAVARQLAEVLAHAAERGVSVLKDTA